MSKSHNTRIKTKTNIKTIPSNCPPPEINNSKGLRVFVRAMSSDSEQARNVEQNHAFATGRIIRHGFTLAEILITLAIIGIIAILTIPNLLAKYEEKALVVRLKDSYSLLSNSYRITIQEDGLPSEWGYGGRAAWDTESQYIALQHITKHLKIEKWCLYPDPNVKDCFASSTYKNVANVPVSTSLATTNSVQLANGTSLQVKMNDPNCKINNRGAANKQMCGELKIDTNGPKGPNMYGKDLWHFIITANGIVPHDFRQTDQWYSECNNTKKTNDGYNGWGCTGWALDKGNFDYLHCSTDTLKTKGKCN